MEEKIGIEKLYELLFEYSRNKSYYWTLRPSGKIEGDVGGTDHTLENEEVSMVIKSKEFGFIKWLVENDKIDLWNKEYECYWNEMYKDTDTTDAIIMELSISDTPIEELISYLK